MIICTQTKLPSNNKLILSYNLTQGFPKWAELMIKSKKKQGLLMVVFWVKLFEGAIAFLFFLKGVSWKKAWETLI